MAVKYLCDRCGDEVKEQKDLLQVCVAEPGAPPQNTPKVGEVCATCRRELLDWLKQLPQRKMVLEGSARG